MGNHASGRRRPKSITLEDLERRDARDFGTRREAMPDGGTREMGLCPQCNQGAREVFRKPDAPSGKESEGPEYFACRRCLSAQGVRHRSENERGTIAEKLRRTPELLGEAIEGAASFARSVESGEPTDQKRFLFAMGIFNAAANQSPEELLAQAQAQIVADDLERTTRLANHLEAMIFAGVENHVNRKGEATVTPMRPDSLAKLGNLYLGALNVRANRAGIATTISERRELDGASGSSVGDLFMESLRKINHITPQGYSLADVIDNKPLPAHEPKSEEEQQIFYKRRKDESGGEIFEGGLLFSDRD